MIPNHRISGVWEEDQLTPKPLKIKKHLPIARERHETIAKSSTSTTNLENSALVCQSRPQAAPRLSLISLIDEICGLAQCHHSNDDFEEEHLVSKAIAPSPPGLARLTVRKTRRSTAISESCTDNTAVEGADNGSSAARCTTLTRCRDNRNGHACADLDEARLVLLDTENIMRQLSIPTSVTRPSLRHSRRSKSCSARPSSDRDDCINAAEGSKSSQFDLVRQSSKLRFLNRLASGFDTMITGYKLADEVQHRCEEQHKYFGAVHHRSDGAQNRSGSDQDRIPAKLRCVTVPAPSSRSSFDSDLGSTIASFPSPPTSSFTTLSPPHTTQSSLITTQTSIAPYGPARSRDPNNMSSEDTYAIGAKLTLIPEKEGIVSADPEKGTIIFVAIEIEGIVCRVSKDVVTPLQPKHLDLAVVIDNSLFTSPAALMSACESTIAIAHSLEAKTDRLALFQTSPDPDQPHSSANLLLLEKPDLRTLKTVLDTVEVCAGVPEPDCLAATITLAHNYLTGCPRVSVTNGQGQKVIRQTIVFTSRPDTVTSTSCSEYSVGVHVICAGSVPWKSEMQSTGDGWNIDYQPSFRDLSAAGKLKDEKHISERIRNLISLLRSSSAPGELHGFELCFRLGSFCGIRSIMGPTSFQTLRPGEIIKTVVKIEMLASDEDTNSMSSHGNELKPILGVIVRYTHSLLPGGTICQLQSAARIKIVSNLHQEQNEDPKPNSASRSDELDPETALVQKSIMYGLATTCTPAYSLNALFDFFGRDVGASTCPEYLILLVAELKYQSRVAARLNLFDTNTGDCDYERDCNKKISKKGGVARMKAGAGPTSWFRAEIDPSSKQYRRVRIESTNSTPQEPVNEVRQNRFQPNRRASMESVKTIQQCTVDEGREVSSETDRYASIESVRGTPQESVDEVQQIWSEPDPRASMESVKNTPQEAVDKVREIRSENHSTRMTAGVRPTHWLHEGNDPSPEEFQFASNESVRDTVREPVDEARKLSSEQNRRRVAIEPARSSQRRTVSEPHKIWTGIRKVSKGHVSSIFGYKRAAREPRVIEEQRQIRELAVRNRRSIGQDTLDSMTYETRGQENVVPWLR
ncbi:hypothetical protein MMC11_001200 [Xylographa trunciseda]|nr:hypothetical protein [Xylographa trunciseda]